MNSRILSAGYSSFYYSVFFVEQARCLSCSTTTALESIEGGADAPNAPMSKVYRTVRSSEDTTSLQMDGSPRWIVLKLFYRSFDDETENTCSATTAAFEAFQGEHADTGLDASYDTVSGVDFSLAREKEPSTDSAATEKKKKTKARAGKT